MKRKILSLILVFAMTVSLLTVGTGAVEPTYGDTAGHWAESSIERWSGHGIIQGSNGLFDPNGQLTCAQLATILAKLLKLPAAKDAGFTDNTADAWYYDAINRCAAAGILNGNGDGTVTPEAPITRERAMVMLARALGIEPIRKPDLTKYTDAAQVSAYAQGYVAALIEAGIVGGVTADELAPQDNINRASTVTILDRAISTYADKAGATVKADGKGIVLVVAENVKITDAPEGTKIVVADGATGLTVNGKSVSDDQTYIVPKTEPAKPSSSSSGGSYTPPHSHSYDTSKWVFDDTKHWHASTCGHNLKIDEAEHTYENDVCTVCGQVKADVAVAKIGNQNYKTLAEAIGVATDGDTVTLVKDISNFAGVTIAKDLTIDFGTYTLIGAVGVTVIKVQNAVVTLNGTTGGINGGNGGNNVAIWASDDCTINITGGNYTVGGDANDSGNSTVYVVGNGKVNISGGTFSSEKTYRDKYYVLNLDNSATGSISVTGGTFVGQNPGVGDDHLGGTFLAPGYKSVETSAGSGVWTVSKMTWNEYPEDASVTPEGFSFTDSNYSVENPSTVTRTVHIGSKDALLYYAYRFNKTEAYNHCKNHGGEGGDSYCIWYQNSYVNSGINFITVVELECDIDFENETLPRGMEIYGTTFKGNGHTIKNAEVNGTTENDGNAGLFFLGAGGSAYYASIENLKIDNVRVETSTTYNENAQAGIVVSHGTTSIKNVTVTSSSAIGGKYTGAIAGFIDGGSITGCTVQGCTVSGQYKIGGVVGQIGAGAGNVTDNTLTGVTLESASVLAGKTAVIGKFVGDWNATTGECSGNTFSGTTDATGDIGKIESGRTVNGVTYVTVTPDTAKTVQYGSTSNVTYLLTKGQYGDFSAYLRSSENVTFIADKEATFTKVEIGYHAGQDGSLAAKTNSTLTARGFHVTGHLFINAADQKAVVEDNTAAQITVKTNVIENMDIQVNNNKLTGGDASVAPQGYGIYIVPNKTNYSLTVTGNSFENIQSHAISVQGCGDGSAATETKSITVSNNTFTSYGTNNKSDRAAFKIWEDAKLAPNGTSELNDSAKALAANIQANNTFTTLGNNCVLADFYGKTVPFSPTSPM